MAAARVISRSQTLSARAGDAMPGRVALEIQAVTMPNSESRRILIILCLRGFRACRHGRSLPLAEPAGAVPVLAKRRAQAAIRTLRTHIAGGFGRALSNADRHHLDRMADLAKNARDQVTILLQQRMGLAPACLDMKLETVLGGPQAQLDPAKLGGLELDMQYPQPASGLCHFRLEQRPGLDTKPGDHVPHGGASRHVCCQQSCSISKARHHAGHGSITRYMLCSGTHAAEQPGRGPHVAGTRNS